MPSDGAAERFIRFDRPDTAIQLALHLESDERAEGLLQFDWELGWIGNGWAEVAQTVDDGAICELE
jgi:hypothetical protein